MKKLIALGCVLSVFAPAALAIDGTVNFDGEILTTACTVTTATANQTVALGSVARSALATTGATAAAKGFTIGLSACPADSDVVVRFEGTPLNGDTAVLGLTSGSTATGVGVQIRDAQQQIVRLAEDSSQYSLTGTAGTLNFTARYIATGASGAAAGTADASATFAVIYQ